MIEEGTLRIAVAMLFAQSAPMSRVPLTGSIASQLGGSVSTVRDVMARPSGNSIGVIT